MNKKLLRVLEQLDMGDQNSLICEVPQGWLSSLNAKDGEVNLDGLLSLCKKIAQEEEQMAEVASAEIIDESEEFEEKMFWFRMIFDQSLAVEPLKLTQKKNSIA